MTCRVLPATFHEPAQLWAIDPSLLLVHICGTIHHFISVSLSEFRRLLKTHLFDLLLDVVHLINVLTYLLTYLLTYTLCTISKACEVKQSTKRTLSCLNNLVLQYSRDIMKRTQRSELIVHWQSLLKISMNDQTLS